MLLVTTISDNMIQSIQEVDSVEAQIRMFTREVQAYCITVTEDMLFDGFVVMDDGLTTISMVTV